MYVRFVLKQSNVDTGVHQGFFDAAYSLSRREDVPQFVADYGLSLIDWFEVHLLTPTRFNRSSAKGAYRRATKGISWFKPQAKEHIRKGFELAAFLNDHGYGVHVLTCARAGYVVYEDDHQIVAEPFRDTHA